MSDYLISMIRTVVPVGVGAVLSWLAVRAGIVVDEQTKAGLLVAFTGLAVAVYYGVVRALELRWPWFGRLLGSKAAPTYPGEAPAATTRYAGRLPL